MPDAKYEVLPILREVNVGNLLGRRIVDCEAEYGPSYMENRYLTNFAPYGGEDRAALQQRIREFLTMLEQAPYETVAVFGHGTYIMNLLDVITGVHHNKRQICCDNGSVTVIEFDGGLWHLRAWNCREFA